MPKKSYLYVIAVILTASIFALSLIFFDSPTFANLLNSTNETIQPDNIVNQAQKTNTDSSNNKPIKNHDNSQGPFRVVKVRDGDTIELDNGMVIRYLYVDTPESVKPGTQVQCFGAESSTFNKEYVFDKVVYLVKDKDEKDQYGRDLRLVFIEGKDTTKPEQSINAELVKLGFAKAKFYSPNTTYRKQFQDIEQTAKDKKLGLWGTCELKSTDSTK